MVSMVSIEHSVFNLSGNQIELGTESVKMKYSAVTNGTVIIKRSTEKADVIKNNFDSVHWLFEQINKTETTWRNNVGEALPGSLKGVPGSKLKQCNADGTGTAAG